MKKMIFAILVILPLMSQATEVSDALVGCLHSATTTVKSVVIEHPTLQKTNIDGQDDAILVLTCSGATAERLYRTAGALGGYDKGVSGYGYFESKWSRGNTVRTVYVGKGLNDGQRSQCNLEILDANNNPTNRSWCNLIIDLKKDLLGNLDMVETIKTTVIPHAKQETEKQKLN